MSFDDTPKISGQESYQDSLISDRSKDRSHSHFTDSKSAAGVKPHPSPLFISGGLPNPIGFPIEEIIVKLNVNPSPRPRFLPGATLFSKPSVPDTFPETTKSSETLSQDLVINKYAKDKESAINGTGIVTLERALQYGEQGGNPNLKKFVTALTKKLHQPKLPDSEWSALITNGGGDGIHKAVDLLINAGDNVLVEEYCFSPSFDNIKAVGGKLVPIKLDHTEGLVVADLKRILETWNEVTQGRKPKVLYSVPSGQNPYGVSQSLERRKQIYAILKAHKIAIIEDDPYGALAYPKYDPSNPHLENNLEVNVDEYLTRIAPSYLTIDDVGLVVRIDTFSKVFSPGLRLGWLVAHNNFIHKLSLYTSLSTRAASGISQAVINNIAYTWGLDGWLKWCNLLRNQYLVRRDHLLSQLDKLDKNKITYIEPECGMFVSAIVHFDKIDGYKGDAYPFQLRLVDLGVEEGVLVVSGSNMAANESLKHSANFIRLTFAYEDADLLDEAIVRLGKAVDRLFLEGLPAKEKIKEPVEPPIEDIKEAA